MVVKQQNFSAMFGHVIDGQEVILESGDTVTIRAAVRGWTVEDSNGKDLFGPIEQGAMVEALIVNRL